VFPVSGPSTGLSSSPISKRSPRRAQIVDEVAVRLVGEPLGDRFRALRADPFDLLDLLLRGGQQPVDVLEVAREIDRGDPADVRDVEPEEDAVERDLLRRVDRLDCVRRRDLAVALELHQLLLRQPVQVRNRAHDSQVPQSTYGLLTDALDVGRRLHPVDQRLEPA
jgi:hypothetical protein